jgi:hypothetical protein
MQTQHDTDKQKAESVDVLHREKERAVRTIETLERQLASLESRMSPGPATGPDVSR